MESSEQISTLFMHATSYEIDPMNSLTLENVLSVANNEKMKVKVKVESNLSWVPEKSDKISTRLVGN